MSRLGSYALSFDGDRKRDVWNSVPDILASIANYLKHFKWKLHAPIYAELGHELKDRRLIAASLKGRQGSVSWQLLRQVQRSDLLKPRDHAKLFIVGLELPPGAGARMRYIACYPNFRAITNGTTPAAMPWWSVSWPSPLNGHRRQAQTIEPRPAHPDSFFAVALALLPGIFFGCAPAPLVQVYGSKVPRFTDDLDRGSLKLAVKHSLDYLAGSRSNGKSRSPAAPGRCPD